MMPALYVESDGAKYVHWGVVVAMAVLMVLWFLKCGSPFREGFAQFNGEGNPVAANANRMANMGAWSGSANINRTIPSDTALSPSVARVSMVDGVYNMGNRGDFGPSLAGKALAATSGFLNGPQSPWIPAPETQYTGHNYMSAVHNVAQLEALKDAGYAGANTDFSSIFGNKVNGFIGGLEAWELEGVVGGKGTDDSGGDFSARGPAEGQLMSIL